MPGEKKSSAYITKSNINNTLSLPSFVFQSFRSTVALTTMLKDMLKFSFSYNYSDFTFAFDSSKFAAYQE